MLHAIFKDDVDQQGFLQTLAEMCHQTGVEVHAYCLMGNQYRLLIETQLGNLVAGMKWLQGACTQRLEMGHEMRVLLPVREIAANRTDRLAKLKRRVDAVTSGITKPNSSNASANLAAFASLTATQISRSLVARLTDTQRRGRSETVRSL